MKNGRSEPKFQEGAQLNPILLHQVYSSIKQSAGGRLNKKDGLTRYGDSHVKDKTS